MDGPFAPTLQAQSSSISPWPVFWIASVAVFLVSIDVSGVAGALGPSLDSFLVDRFGWPWAFFLNLPLGTIALWCGRRIFDESRDPERGAPIDFMGVVLLTLGVGSKTGRTATSILSRCASRSALP